MSQDDPYQSKTSLPKFEIPAWFQESVDDRAHEEEDLGPAIGLPDIFDDQPRGDQPASSADRSAAPEIAAAIQGWGRPAGPGLGDHRPVAPQGEAPAPGLGPQAQRLTEIAEAIALMARTLRHWEVEGAAGAALILSSLAAELAGLAATDTRRAPGTGESHPR